MKLSGPRYGDRPAEEPFGWDITKGIATSIYTSLSLSLSQNSELNTEIEVLRVRLGELQHMPAVTVEPKPHYIARPGSPTAEDQVNSLSLLFTLLGIMYAEIHCIAC